MLMPGCRAIWRYTPPYPTFLPLRASVRFIPYNQPCRVLSIGKRTAHIEVRRRDGKLVRRYVKLEKLSC